MTGTGTKKRGLTPKLTGAKMLAVAPESLAKPPTHTGCFRVQCSDLLHRRAEKPSAAGACAA
jgi:hypothetical protein